MVRATLQKSLSGLNLVGVLMHVQARRSTEAPLNAASRVLRRQTAGPYGGFGGRRQQRHMIYSRFRCAPGTLQCLARVKGAPT